MKVFSNQSKFVPAASGLALLIGAQIAVAESACSGLIAEQCSSQAACLWVKGYTRKDGKSVKGYCRSKGGKGATVSDDSERQTSTSERGGSSGRVTAAAARLQPGS